MVEIPGTYLVYFEGNTHNSNTMFSLDNQVRHLAFLQLIPERWTWACTEVLEGDTSARQHNCKDTHLDFRFYKPLEKLPSYGLLFITPTKRCSNTITATNTNPNTTNKSMTTPTSLIFSNTNTATPTNQITTKTHLWPMPQIYYLQIQLQQPPQIQFSPKQLYGHCHKSNIHTSGRRS